MNTNDPRFELIRRCRDDEATAEELVEFEASLLEDADFRESYVRYTNLYVALSTASNLKPIPATTRGALPSRGSVWLSWPPLTAAAAGILFGMFCTSMVYGFVVQREGVVDTVPLEVFDPGIENAEMILDHGVPHWAGRWGADSARVVEAENGVQPLEGQRMMRIEPIPREKNVKNLASRVYQVLDLRLQPMANMVGEVEVQVTASFFSTKSEASSRYLIRAFAIDEAPEEATDSFWSKTEDDGVVSVAQRFNTSPGDSGWHTFSLKMPLPRGAQTLVFILGALPPDDPSVEASVHYLDKVQVSMFVPQEPLP